MHCVDKSQQPIMEEEKEDSKLEELIHDLALRDRQSRDGISSPPPPVPPRPARRSAPAATPTSGQSFDPNGDLGLPLVNSSKRENYSKIVLNKRMWVSLKETDVVECENMSG